MSERMIYPKNAVIRITVTEQDIDTARKKVPEYVSYRVCPIAQAFKRRFRDKKGRFISVKALYDTVYVWYAIGADSSKLLSFQSEWEPLNSKKMADFMNDFDEKGMVQPITLYFRHTQLRTY